MFKFIVAGIVTAGICFFVSSCDEQIENTRKHNIHYNTATVVSIGQCRDSKCAYSYKTSLGGIEYSTSETPLTTGQIVYQQCWTEKVKGPQCYSNYEPSKRND